MPFKGSDIIAAAKEFSPKKLEEGSLQELILRKLKTSFSNPFDEDEPIFDIKEEDEIRKFIRTIYHEESEIFNLDELSEKLGLERTRYGKFSFPEYEDFVEKEEAKKLFYQNLLGHLVDGELFAEHVRYTTGKYSVNLSDFLLFVKLHTLKQSKEIPEDYEYKSFLGLIRKIVEQGANLSQEIKILNDVFKVLYNTDKLSKLFVYSSFSFDSNPISKRDERELIQLEDYSYEEDRFKNICLYVIFGKLEEDEAIPKKYSKYDDFVKWVNETIINVGTADQKYTMKAVLDKIKEEIKKEKEKEASIKIQKIARGIQGRNIAKEKRKEREKTSNKERTSASENIDPIIDAQSSSVLEIPQIKGFKSSSVEKYKSGFKVFNYPDLNSFSEDFNEADGVDKSNWNLDKYLFSIVCISGLDERSKRYCIVTSSRQGVTKSFISRAEFRKIVNGESYLYDKENVDPATETEIDNSNSLKEIASLYEQKKDLENALRENQENREKTSSSLAKSRINPSSLNDEEDHKSRNQDHDNQVEALTIATVSLDEVVLDGDATNPLHSANTNESLVLAKTSTEEQPRSIRESENLRKLENLTNKREDLIKQIEDYERKISDSWEETKDESQTGEKKPKSDNMSDKKSQTIVSRIKESIKNGFNHALDDSEVEGIAEDMAKAHKEAVYFYTEEKEDDCKKNVSKLLKSNSPHNPLNGVSFLRPKGTKIVSVAFNYSEIGKRDNLNGSNEAYVYITGTDNCYVRCAVCQRDGDKMVVWKNGVASTEEHKRGDVVIDENTVSFLDEKTGHYTRVKASKSDLRGHLKKIKYPGNENTIIDQLADLQIKVVSQIDSAMSGQEPDIESKVAIMYKGKSRSYNNRDDDKIVISRKKIAKTLHLTPHEDKKTKEVTANFVEIDESNKISSVPIGDEQFVKIHDISSSSRDGKSTITNLYAKIRLQDEKVIQDPNLFYDSGEGKMEALNAEVIKTKHSLSDQKASEMFDASKRISKNTKITFSNGKNRITSTILDEAKLPENKPSASPEPTSCFNCFGAASRSVGVY